MLYLITNVANRHKEFRMTTDEDGNAAYFDKVLPCYKIFYNNTATFPMCGRNTSSTVPMENAIPVSMIPWEKFSSFTLNIEEQEKVLLPIFTMGKYYREGNRIMMTLAIQVNHAACDGYHVSVFIKS